jgi:hypothetical protein
VLRGVALLATFAKTRIDSLATGQSVNSFCCRAQESPWVVWEVNRTEAQREVGETRLLTKEEFVGKVAVSTNAQPRAPRRGDELRGAVIAGRRTYDLSVPWWGRRPDGKEKVSYGKR